MQQKNFLFENYFAEIGEGEGGGASEEDVCHKILLHIL